MAEESQTSPAVAPDTGDSRADPKPEEPSTEQPAAANDADKAGDGETKPEESTPAERAESTPAEGAEKTGDGEEEQAPDGGDESAAAPGAGAANGTPASKSKSKRKSTAGGSRKQSRKHRNLHLDAKPGEYYLARLKSFPPWPAIICDEEMLPQSLLNTRPVTTKQADGTYKEPYADGGKRVYDRTFPVMFLETNEFAWMPNTDLTPLDPEQCKNIPEKGKQKQLIAAYKIAAENHDLQYFKNLLAEHQRAVQQEAEEREAEAARKAAQKAEKEARAAEKKKKRKSTADTDVEMADAEEEDKKSKSKKRKKEAESDAEEEKPPKTPKTTQKLKLTTPKEPPASEKSKASAKKKGGKKEAARESSEETPKPVDPEEARARREKEILFIRHKLQKGFISRDSAPKEEEMEAMARFIARLEGYENLEVSIIRSTKISKVLKAIIRLNTIPRDEEFNIRRRAMDILAKWKNLLDSDVAAAEAKEATPQANGVHKEGGEGEEEKADAEEKEKEKEKTPAENKTEAEAKETTREEPMPDAAPADDQKETKEAEAGAAEAAA
ncbi:hypothetical protein VTN49DRAFT_6107 [Thermomyces lanuginosus]|uniref:uncharacterized protein n=1 Tax=Thermomyces lanuginosus TaxID=5541 RepID=UPI0037443489